MPIIYDGVEHPVRIGPGRSDLRYSSVPAVVPYDSTLATATTVQLVGGRHVSFAKVFATQPWVAAAVMRLLSWSIRVPLKVYRRTGSDSRMRLGPKDHPLAAAIMNPWRRGSQADFTMSMLGPLLVHGNALDEIQSGAGEQIRFQAADWRFARPVVIESYDGRIIEIAGWDLDADEDMYSRTVGADTVIHTRWWSPYGPLGISPLQQLGMTIAIDDAAQRHQKAMLSNGARPPSAITVSPEFLGWEPEKRQALLDQLSEDVGEIYSGPENNGRPALLPPGLDWKEVGHTAVEAELINQRKIAQGEVCAVYQIQPPMLGVLDRATFNNIETAREMSYTDSLGPPLVLIEQTINAQVIQGLLREDDIYVEYDFAGVLRGNRLNEVEALREAIATGLLTPNEARTIDNRPTSDTPGMDDHYLPLNNLQPIGRATADPTQITNPADTEDDAVGV